MTKTRLEAFSDGVIAILITIMVLELKVPYGSDVAALRPLIPKLLGYVLSFAYLAIYWNNHHHLLHAAQKVNGRILWANMHLMFWLSLVPFTTAWVGENGFPARPVALYGVVLFFAGFAYYLLVHALIAHHGKGSKLAAAIGRDIKGKVSVGVYAAAIAVSFYNSWIAYALYWVVAAIWLVPDRRIEKALTAGP